MTTNKILFFGLTLICLVSCKKQDITPGNYKSVKPIADTTKWQNTYTNGGNTPTWSANTNKNVINGTNWILVSYNDGFVTITKGDTIHFITNNHYLVGSDTTKNKYSLYNTNNNSTIVLNQFNPINGLYLSANNFNEVVFTNTPVGSKIELRFKDNFSGVIYKSIFKKI